jgi:hypothetical protein
MSVSIDAITVKAIDLITNELIDEINPFDAAKITAEAKAYKMP